MIVYDPARPLEQRSSELAQMIVVKMSLAQAKDRVPGLRDMVGIPLSGNRGGGALVSCFLREAWTQLETSTVAEWAMSFVDAFWSVLPLADASDQGVAREKTIRQQRWHEVQSVVARNLTEMGYGSREIAGELGVSVRDVQMIFAEQATTSSEYIKRRRVEYAAEKIRNNPRGMSITDLAFDVGFGDASSFCRAFKRFYKVSPREYRSGKVGGSELGDA